jgi:hypothetical protein
MIASRRPACQTTKQTQHGDKSMGFLTDKRFLITGVASNRSIAWGVAQAMHQQGAQLAFSYQGEKLQGRVEDLAAKCDSKIVLPLDVSSDEQIDDCFAALGSNGTAWMASSTPSPSHPRKNWRATTSTP